MSWGDFLGRFNESGLCSVIFWEARARFQLFWLFVADAAGVVSVQNQSQEFSASQTAIYRLNAVIFSNGRATKKSTHKICCVLIKIYFRTTTCFILRKNNCSLFFVIKTVSQKPSSNPLEPLDPKSTPQAWFLRTNFLFFFQTVCFC